MITILSDLPSNLLSDLLSNLLVDLLSNLLVDDKSDSREGHLAVVRFDAPDVVRGGAVQCLHEL